MPQNLLLRKAPAYVSQDNRTRTALQTGFRALLLLRARANTGRNVLDTKQLTKNLKQ